MTKPFLFDDVEARMIVSEALVLGKSTALLHQTREGTAQPFALSVVGREGAIMLGLNREQVETLIKQGQALLESQS